MAEDPWRVPTSKSVDRKDGPWVRPSRQDPRSPSAPAVGQPSGVVRLIVFLLGIGLLLLGLSMAFPVSSAFDTYLVRGVLILVIFGSAAVFWSRSSIWRLLKVAGLWAIIILGISSFYLFRSDFGDRFMSAVDPSGVITTENGMLVHRDRDGHFWLRAEMDGVPIRFMVDTGASNIVLSPDDARRVGLNMRALSFDRTASTANGEVRFAKATISTMQIGDQSFYDVSVTVNGAEMQGSLLGMAVLQKFSSVEFRGDTLILRP